MQLNLNISVGQGSSTALLDHLCLKSLQWKLQSSVAWHCILSSRRDLEARLSRSQVLAQFCFLQLFGPRTPSVCCLQPVTLTLQLVIRIPVSCHVGLPHAAYWSKNSKRNSPKRKKKRANGTTLCNITIILYWLEATPWDLPIPGRDTIKSLIISRQG